MPALKSSYDKPKLIKDAQDFCDLVVTIFNSFSTSFKKGLNCIINFHTKDINNKKQ